MDDKTQLAKEAHDSLVIIYKEHFCTESGRKILADLEKFCYFKEPILTNTLKIKDILLIQGARNLYLHILKMVETEITAR
jgi:hypothetical protein